jgi:hypothetical protein
MNKLPKGMQRVYVMADKCCRVLIMKGMNIEIAEETVLDALKEHESDLRMGNYKKVETALEVKFA